MSISTNINNSNIDVTQYQQQVVPTTTTSVTPIGEATNNQASQDTADHDERRKEFVEAIEKANHIETGKTECQFSIHEATNHLMVKIVDQQTKEVIKELPSEKILDMVAKMCEFAGVFVDEKG